MTLTRRTLSLAIGLAFGACAIHAQAQTKWDLPAAYPAGNFHTVNLVEFANDIDKASGGKLKIEIFPAMGISLYQFKTISAVS